MYRKADIISIQVIMGTLVWMSSGMAASFSCVNVKQPYAVAICSNEQLSSLDQIMGQRYQVMRDGLSGSTQLSFIDSQLNWVDAVKRQCNIPESGVLSDQQISTQSLCLQQYFARRVTDIDNGVWLDNRASNEANLSLDERQQIQNILIKIGVYAGKADGRFGPGMRKSIASAQQKYGIAITGYVNAELLSKIGINVALSPQLIQATNNTPSVSFRWVPQSVRSSDVAQVENINGSKFFISCSYNTDDMGPSIGYEYKNSPNLLTGMKTAYIVVDGRSFTVPFNGGRVSIHNSSDLAVYQQLLNSLIGSSSQTITVEVPALQISEQFTLLDAKSVLGNESESFTNCSVNQDEPAPVALEVSSPVVVPQHASVSQPSTIPVNPQPSSQQTTQSSTVTDVYQRIVDKCHAMDTTAVFLCVFQN